MEQDVAQRQDAASSSRAAPAAPPRGAGEPGPRAAAAAAAARPASDVGAARCLADARFAVIFTFIALASFLRSLLGSAGADAGWRDHAALAGYAVSNAALAGLAAGSPTYRRPRVRHSLIAAFRLCAFLGADHTIHSSLMDLPPQAGLFGSFVDLAHLALGTEAVKLFLFATFLPLPLPAQLVVCTLNLVLPMRANPQSCGLKLMDSPASASRVAAFHDWLSVGAMGILPGFPGAGRVQCVAALDFVQLLLGWLLPTFLVARARWQAVQARASTQTNARREPDLDARLACWLMDSVFLADAPDGLPVLAWFILLTLAWLAAGLVGVALVG